MSFIIGTAGQGVDFSTTANTSATGASTSSELLDWYEEGTWTPYYYSTSGAFTTLTYAQQEGTYTRIGDILFLGCRLLTSAVTVGTASGQLYVGGFPFSVSYFYASIVDINQWSSNFPDAIVSVGSTSGMLRYRTSSNGDDSYQAPSSMAGVNNGNQIRFAGWGKVA